MSNAKPILPPPLRQPGSLPPASRQGIQYPAMGYSDPGMMTLMMQSQLRPPTRESSGQVMTNMEQSQFNVQTDMEQAQYRTRMLQRQYRTKMRQSQF